jgi:hypothetical protein
VKALLFDIARLKGLKRQPDINPGGIKQASKAPPAPRRRQDGASHHARGQRGQDLGPAPLALPVLGHDAFACAHAHGAAIVESGKQRFLRFRLDASRSNG